MSKPNDEIQVNKNIFTDLRTEMTPAIALCDLLLVEKYGKLDTIQKDKIQRILDHLTNMVNIIPIISDEIIPESLQCKQECFVNGKLTSCTRGKSHNGECVFAS